MRTSGLFCKTPTHNTYCRTGLVCLWWLLFLPAWIVALNASETFAKEITAPQTLLQIIEKAYNNSLVLQKQQSILRSADQEILLAKSVHMPKVFLEAGAGFFSRTDPSSGLRHAGGQTGAYNELRLSFKQTLLDGFENQHLVAANKARWAVEENRLRYLKQQVIINAVGAYADLRHARNTLKLARVDRRFARRQAILEQERFGLGQATLTHLSLTRGYKRKAELNYNSAELDLKVAEANFKKYTGIDAKTVSNVSSLGIQFPKTLDAIKQIVIGDHPLLRINESLLEEAASLANRERSAYLPKLYMEGYLSAGTSPETLLENVSAIGLRLKMPLLDRAGLRSKVSRYQEARVQLQLEHEQQIAEFFRTIEKVHATHTAAINNRKVLQSAVKSMKQAFTLALQERDHALKSTPDLLEVHQLLSETTLQSYESDRAVLVSRFALLSATGRLDLEALGIHGDNQTLSPVSTPQFDFSSRNAPTTSVSDHWVGLRNAN